MLKKMSLLLVGLSCLSLFCQEKREDDKFINLNFFEVVDGKPTHWKSLDNGYQIVYKDGKIGIKDSLGIEGKFGMVLNQIPIEFVRGKTVRISSSMQTSSFNKNVKVGLWCGVNNPSGPSSTKDWTTEIILNTPLPERHFVEIKVDSIANAFYFGVMSEGKEEVIFGRFAVSIDGVYYNDIGSKELSEKQVQWLRNQIHPLITTDPETTDNNDLKILAEIIDDSKVVALGEVTHGAKEIFELKDRIIRYLTENKGYDVFSMEANLPECYVINRDFIIEGKGNAEDHLKTLSTWPWETKQVKAMLEWMQSYKQKGGKIQFTGFDMQLTGQIFRSLEESFVEHPQYLSQVIQLKSDISTFMQKLFMSVFKNPDLESKKRILQTIDELDLVIVKENFNNKNILQENLKILKQSLDPENRDRYMANNLLDIMDKNSESKFTLWAHNLHIANIKGIMGNI